MKRKSYAIHLILSFLLLQTGTVTALAQPDPPVKPEMHRVSIDSVSGYTQLEWEASPTPGILGYKVYTLDITTDPVTGYLLDSLPGDVLSYSYLETAPGIPYYTVTAVDENGESLLSGNFHRPVALEIQYDSCSSSMELNWEKYVGWGENLNGYVVYAKHWADDCDCDDGASTEQAEGDFVPLDTLMADEHTFTHKNVDENMYYEYVVEAFDNQNIKSTSNRLEYFTYMPAPPEFISLDYVSVLDERSVEISISADISGEINDFLVSRSASPEGIFTPVQTLMDVTESNVQITDAVVTQGQRFYYRVEALNSCYHPVKTSNLGNNILARGSAEESVVRLEWNSYEEFAGGVADYTIFRSNGYGELERIATVPSGSLSFTENIRNSGERNIEGAVNYLIEARENGTNPLGVTGVSRSNKVVVNIETRMYLPNAFTPNNDGRNDYFAPVLDFIPEEYRMFIYDRTGKILFRSLDPLLGWDGSINGTGKAREGVYVYHIEYLSFNGTRQIATGNVTLVYP